jgi:hypothetical protein
MSLHVIIGYPELGAKGQPVPVYVGRSAAAARDAKAANTACACFDEFHNVNPLRKHNSNFKPRTEPAADILPPVEAAVEAAATAKAAAPRGRGK